jgi:osmotically inducible protein OsmC
MGWITQGRRRAAETRQRRLGATAAGPTLTRIELETEGSVPGIDDEKFRAHAETAKNTCLVSRALAGVPDIRLKATLAEPNA